MNILGVKDKPDGTREVFGIQQEEFIDSSIYQNVILENIEPEIKLDYFPIEQFEIKFMENSLMAVHDEQGCARTSITIRNYTIFVGFESSDCLRLNLDEYGTTEERFILELLLTDTYNNEYCCRIDDGWIFADGKFLWKVQLKTKKERN